LTTQAATDGGFTGQPWVGALALRSMLFTCSAQVPDRDGSSEKSRNSWRKIKKTTR